MLFGAAFVKFLLLLSRSLVSQLPPPLQPPLSPSKMLLPELQLSPFL
jgi:hypothetical protein